VFQLCCVNPYVSRHVFVYFSSRHSESTFPFMETYRASLQVVFELAAKFVKTFKKLYILCTNAKTLLTITAKFGLQNRKSYKNLFKIPNRNITREMLMESLNNTNSNFSFQCTTRVRLL
jgi:hypothetical protein